jgi:hypothetical protein
MTSIINDALVILSDLELNLNVITSKLNDDERHGLAEQISQVVGKLGELSENHGLTEQQFAELANDLIEVVNASDSVRETLSADEEISSAQERAAQLAVFEKNEQAGGSAGKPQTDRRETEQFEFLANQIINRCQIIRQKLEPPPKQP